MILQLADERIKSLQETINNHNFPNTRDENMWILLLKRMRLRPEEAKAPNAQGKLPLQTALESNAPLHVIESIFGFYPDAICCTDAKGRTPLFSAVAADASPEIIEFLLTKYPSAASQADSIGEIPLHVVQSVSIANLLIQIYPEGIYSSSKARWLPFHTVRTSNIAQLLIEHGTKHNFGRNNILCSDQTSINDNYNEHKCRSISTLSYKGPGGLFQKDKYGQTPLQRLNSSLTWCLRAAKASSQITASSPSTHSHIPLSCATSVLWEKLTVLTRAAAFHYMYTREDCNLRSLDVTTSPKNNFQMLHSLVELRIGSKDVLEVAMDLFPDMICSSDAFGRTPLAIAIENKGDPDFDFISYEREEDKSEYRDDLDTPSNGVVTSYEIVHMLLKRSKIPARIADLNGRLPLHIAAESKRNFSAVGGVRDIIMAEPRALEARDPKTGMYPFMIAAVGNSYSLSNNFSNDEHLKSLDTVFGILREGPSVLQLISNKEQCNGLRGAISLRNEDKI